MTCIVRAIGFIYFIHWFLPMLSLPSPPHAQVNDHETAEQVVGLTRAIAQMPYRASESALGCVTKVKASGGPGATAGEAKKAAWDVWVAQLQMIPSASDKKARAIATKFPSFRALADAYADPARSELEKQELLSVSTQRHGCGTLIAAPHAPLLWQSLHPFAP